MFSSINHSYQCDGYKIILNMTCLQIVYPNVFVFYSKIFEYTSHTVYMNMMIYMNVHMRRKK